MTLVVSLIMLTLVTIIVVAAAYLSMSNVRAVGNMQFRDEAVAAANIAIEDRISARFDTAPVAPEDIEPVSVDLNGDNATDFEVTVVPTCLKATVASSAPPSSLSLPAVMTAAPTWNTLWDVDATATDATTSAAVRVRAGVRVLLPDTTKNTACP